MSNTYTLLKKYDIINSYEVSQMKNVNELQIYLNDLKNRIENIADNNAEMSVFAFAQNYDEKSQCFNYPTFRINLKMQDIKDYANTLLSKAYSALNKTSDIKEFNYNNNKTTIDFIDISKDNSNSEKIKNCMEKILVSNTESLKLARKAANCLAVHIKFDSNDIFLFAKGCPFVKQKQFVFTFDEFDFANPVKCDLKFPLSLSACVFNNEVYLFGNLIESIFGFENSLKEQMSDAIKDIKNSNLFSEESICALEEYSSKGKNYYCYNNYDKSKLNAIKSNNQYAKQFLKRYEIQKNSQGELLIDTEDKQKMINKFLCNDLKRDYIDINQIYDAPGNEVIN